MNPHWLYPHQHPNIQTIGEVAKQSRNTIPVTITTVEETHSRPISALTTFPSHVQGIYTSVKIYEVVVNNAVFVYTFGEGERGVDAMAMG